MSLRVSQTERKMEASGFIVVLAGYWAVLFKKKKSQDEAE